MQNIKQLILFLSILFGNHVFAQQQTFVKINGQDIQFEQNLQSKDWHPSQDEQGQNVTESTSCLYDGNPDRTTFPCPNCAHDIDLLSPPKYPIKRK